MFDPDQFLTGGPAAPAFNPDDYLAGGPQALDKQRRQSADSLVIGGVAGVNGRIGANEQPEYDAALSAAPNPDEVKARVITKNWVQANYPSLAPEIENAWPSVKRQLTKKLTGRDEADVPDGAFNGVLTEYIKARDEATVAGTEMLAKVQEEAFNETGADWLTAYRKNAAKLEGIVGMTPEMRDSYRNAAQQVYAHSVEKTKELKYLANVLTEGMGAEAGVNGRDGKSMGFSNKEFMDMLLPLSDEDRQLVYRMVGTRAKTSDATQGNLDRMQEQKPGQSAVANVATQVEAGMKKVSTKFSRDVAGLVTDQGDAFDQDKLVALGQSVKSADILQVQGERKEGESMLDFIQRTGPGEKGIIDFAKQVLTQTPDKPYRNLTEEEKVALKEESDVAAKQYRISLEMQDLRNGVIDPAKFESRFIEGVTSAPGQIAYSAQMAIPYAGLALFINGNRAQRTRELLGRGVPINEAHDIAIMSSILEAPVEWVQNEMLFGRIPGLKSVFTEPLKEGGMSALMKRTGKVFAMETILQNGQELVQDGTNMVMQDALSRFDPAVPEVTKSDWAQFWQGRIDTAYTMLPITLVGTGVGSMKDGAFARQYLSNKTILKAAGFTEQMADRIAEKAAIGDVEQAQAIVEHGWQDPEQRPQASVEQENAAAAADVASMAKFNTKAQQDAFDELDGEMKASWQEQQNPDGARAIKNEDGTFTVVDSKGTYVDLANNAEEAVGLVRNVNEADSKNLTGVVDDMIDYFKQRGRGGEIEKSEDIKTLGDRVEEGQMTEDKAKQLVQLYTELGILPQGTTPSEARIYGESAKQYNSKTKVFEYISRLYHGADPLVLVEEESESYFKQALDNNVFTLDEVEAWRSQVEGKPVAKKEGDMRHRENVEWFSKYAQAYITGKAQEMSQTPIPLTFKRWLDKMREVFAGIFQLAKDLIEKEKAGQLPEAFQKHLARAVGLDDSFVEQRMREEERAAAQQGTADQYTSKEALHAIKLPTPNREKMGMRGELSNLWESMKFNERMKLFAAHDKSLDKVAEQLREDYGFSWVKGPDDVIKMAEDTFLRDKEYRSDTSAMQESTMAVRKPKDQTKDIFDSGLAGEEFTLFGGTAEDHAGHMDAEEARAEAKRQAEAAQGEMTFAMRKLRTLQPDQLEDKKLKPSHLYVWGNDRSDGAPVPSVTTVPYEGDALTAYRGMTSGDFAPHVIVATDANGKPEKVISPNGRHVADFGTPEAEYIAGDIYAIDRALKNKITGLVASGDDAQATALANKKAAEVMQEAAKFEGYIQRELADDASDRKKLADGKTVTDLDFRYEATKKAEKDYFEQRRRRIESFTQTIAEKQKEAANWQSLIPKDSRAGMQDEMTFSMRKDQSADRAEYDRLQEEMKAMGYDKMGTPEFNKLWQQSEDIKNRNGGMPPGETAGGGVSAASIISLAREIDPQLLASKIKEAKAFIASEEAKGIPLSPRLQADQVTLAARSVLEANTHDERALKMLEDDNAGGTMSLRGPAFYSRLTKTVEDSTQGKASGEQWKAMIRNSKIGVNKDEFALVGVDDLENGKTYSKQEVLDYLKANEVKVEDVTLGGPNSDRLQTMNRNEMAEWYNDQVGYNPIQDDPTMSTEDLRQTIRDYLKEVPSSQNDLTASGTHFDSYTLPGAVEGSYREVLLTVPDGARGVKADTRPHHQIANEIMDAIGMQHRRGLDNYRRDALGNRSYGSELKAMYDAIDATIKAGKESTLEEYRRALIDERNMVTGWEDGHSQYSDVKNPIVRLRLNERQTADGKRMLFLEEVQAPQKANFEKMPALFQKNWREIGFKWALRKAVEGGFDSIGWTTGDQQAERYDLSKQVDAIYYRPDKKTLFARRQGENVFQKDNVEEADLAEYIGKDAAAKIAQQQANIHEDDDGKKYPVKALLGDELKVGGEGLRKLYDQDFRNVVNGLPAVKKSGQKVGTEQIPVETYGGNSSFRYGVVAPEHSYSGKWDVVRRDEGKATTSHDNKEDALSSARALNHTEAKTIHSLAITDAMRDSVEGGQATFALRKADDGKLIAVHNTSENKLRQMDELGGIAAPSVAILKHGTSEFDSFGDISLVAPPDLIDPRKSRASKVFNADVYSPRFPNTRYEVSSPELRKAWKYLSDASGKLGNVLSTEIDQDQLKKDGMHAFENSAAAHLAFLQENGIKPELKDRPVEAVSDAIKERFKEKSPYALANDPEFEKATADHLREEMKDYPDVLKDYLNEDGSVGHGYLNRFAARVVANNYPEVDKYLSLDAMRKQVEEAGLQDKYQAWLQNKFGSVLKGQVIKDYNEKTGNTKNLPYTLENAVRVMKRGLRDGEGFNYGVGSIRSTVAKQFSSISAIKDAQDGIQKHDAIEKLKEETSDEFMQLATDLQPYYKYDATRFGYLDEASQSFKELNQRGMRAWEENFKDTPPELMQRVRDFLQKLANAPTEYFEAKIQRGVQLSEMAGAVIPSNASDETRAILKKHGLRTVEYPKSDKAARAKALESFNEQSFAIGRATRAEDVEAAMKPRMIGIRVKASEVFSDEMKRQVGDLKYQVRGMSVNEREAKAVIEKHDGNLAKLTAILNDPVQSMHPATKVALAFFMAEAANKAGDYATAAEVAKQAAMDATSAGQSVNELKRWSVFTQPETCQQVLQTEIEKENNRRKTKEPAIQAVIDIYAEVQREARKLLRQWLDEINGIAGKTEAELEPVDVSSLPDVTFALRQEVRDTGIVQVVARMLKHSGAAATERALIERYGKGVESHIPDIFIEAQRSLTKREAKGEKKFKTRIPVLSDDQIERTLAATRGKTGEQVEIPTAESLKQQGMSDDQIEETLRQFRNRQESQADLIPGERQTNRMSESDIQSAMDEQQGAEGGSQSMADMPELYDRMLEHMLERIKAKAEAENFVVPQGIKDQLAEVLNRNGLQASEDDVKRIIGARQLVPNMTPAQAEELAGYAKRIASTPMDSYERGQQTMELFSYVHDQLTPHDIVDVAFGLWYANVLSGLVTSFRNIAGNGSLLFLDQATETIFRNPTTYFPYLQQLMKATSVGLEGAAPQGSNTFKTGQEGLLRSRSLDDERRQGVLESKTAPAKTLRSISRMATRFLTVQDLFFANTAYEMKARQLAWDQAVRESKTGKLSADKIEERVSRLLNQATDQIQTFEDRANTEWRILDDQIKADYNEANWKKRRVIELQQFERDHQLVSRSLSFAQKVTLDFEPEGLMGLLMTNLSQVFSKAEHASQEIRNKPVRLMTKAAARYARTRVIPFMRVPVNVFNRALDYGPVGYGRSLMDAAGIPVLQGSKTRVRTAEERSDLMKRATLGTLAMLPLAILCRPPDPDDEPEENPWLQIHGAGSGNPKTNLAINGPKYRAYSLELRIGGNQVFMDYRFFPLAPYLAAIGSLHDRTRYKKTLDDKSALVQGWIIAQALKESFMSSSPITSLRELSEAAAENQPMSERAVNRTLARGSVGMVANLIPLSSLWRSLDQLAGGNRNTRDTLLAASIAELPVAGRLGLASVDVLGDDLKTRAGVGWLADWSKMDTPESRIYQAFAEKDITPTDISRYQNKMTPEMYYDFAKARGTFLKDALMTRQANGQTGLEIMLSLSDKARTKDDDSPAKKFLSRVSLGATHRALMKVGYTEQPAVVVP